MKPFLIIRGPIVPRFKRGQEIVHQDGRIEAQSRQLLALVADLRWLLVVVRSEPEDRLEVKGDQARVDLDMPLNLWVRRAQVVTEFLCKYFGDPLFRILILISKNLHRGTGWVLDLQDSPFAILSTLPRSKNY